MGLLARFRRLLWMPSLNDDEEADYRCIQCGHPHVRQVHACRNCGGSFVALVEAASEDDVRDPRNPN